MWSRFSRLCHPRRMTAVALPRSESLPLKARDEHYGPSCGSRCRCREQRGWGFDAGLVFGVFPCLLRRLAQTLRWCRSRAVAFADRQTFFAPQEAALALLLFPLPRSSGGVVSRGCSSQSFTSFLGSWLGSFWGDFRVIHRFGLVFFNVPVCSCVPHARSLYSGPRKARNSTGKARNSTGKARNSTGKARNSTGKARKKLIDNSP